MLPWGKDDRKHKQDWTRQRKCHVQRPCGEVKHVCFRSRVKSTEARAQECGREQREMQLERWLRGLSEASRATTGRTSTFSLCYMWHNLPMNLFKITHGSYNTLFAPSCLTYPQLKFKSFLHLFKIFITGKGRLKVLLPCLHQWLQEESTRVSSPHKSPSWSLQ